jgi:hypothetical protein
MKQNSLERETRHEAGFKPVCKGTVLKHSSSFRFLSAVKAHLKLLWGKTETNVNVGTLLMISGGFTQRNRLSLSSKGFLGEQHEKASSFGDVSRFCDRISGEGGNNRISNDMGLHIFDGLRDVYCNKFIMHRN